ncbi:uncharacterized protein TNCV_843391 [Trichonephila clavipes]|nr:uncharacterized protein TNCV_843391 [Trichonephila clavipes]
MMRMTPKLAPPFLTTTPTGGSLPYMADLQRHLARTHNTPSTAGINAWILYKQTTGENIPRQDFFTQASSRTWRRDFQEAREPPKQRKNTKESLPKSTTDANQHKKCQIGYCKENKTNKICSKCKKYVCGKCTMDTLICKKCDEQ